MITNDVNGLPLSPTFLNQMHSPALDVTRRPNDRIWFCRKIGSQWYTRELTGKWLAMSDLTMSFGEQFGISQGTICEFAFSTTPITVLKQDAQAGQQTLQVERRILDFYPEVDDWIQIRNNEAIEYQRVSSIGLDAQGRVQSIVVAQNLNNTFVADEENPVEIRYVFALNPNIQELTYDDWYTGYIVVRTGFANLPNEEITVFYGKVASVDEQDNTVLISCKDRVQELVDHSFAERVEFSGSGVASVPTPDPNNTGTGTISDIDYLPKKDPDMINTEQWTISYDSASDGFQVIGSVSGVVGSGDEGTSNFLPEGSIGKKEWVIDTRREDLIATKSGGWRISILEGETAFSQGDNFVFYTRASVGSGAGFALVKGGGYATNPIEHIPFIASPLSYQNTPVIVVQHIIEKLLDWTHEDPLTGFESDLLDSEYFDWAANDLSNQSLHLNDGIFPAGSRAIDIIDDALKPLLGWMTASHEGKLRVILYKAFFPNASPIEPFTPTAFTLNGNIREKLLNLNIINTNDAPIELGKLASAFTFVHGEQSVHIEDDNPEAAGNTVVELRTESDTDLQMSSRFTVGDLTDGLQLRSIVGDLLYRYNRGATSYQLKCHPGVILLELGDTPLIYDQHINLANQRLWISSITINLKDSTRSLILKLEKLPTRSQPETL